MKFNEIIENKQLLKALDTLGFKTPTPIQLKTIEAIKKYDNILAQAQTGSGKTASYILPILESYLKNPILKRSTKDKIKTLILVPTRELALQVESTIKDLCKYTPYPPRYRTIIGGDDISKQLLYIQKGCDIIIATTGRLQDIVDKKQIDLKFVENFIIDEADKMIDIGFKEQLQKILKLLPKNRKNLLFSATYPQKVLDIAKIVADDFYKIVSDEIIDKPNIKQEAILIDKPSRNPLLQHIVKTNDFKKVLVFQSNKKSTDNLARKFRKYGFKADSFHGDLILEDRVYTLNQFKNGELNILFSTDLASRGIDIDDIDCVINYDLPRGIDDYIHRIGRTARARKEGRAISFTDYETLPHLKNIIKKTKQNIEFITIDGFSIKDIPKPKQKGTAPVKGKRKSKKDKLREQKQNGK